MKDLVYRSYGRKKQPGHFGHFFETSMLFGGNYFLADFDGEKVAKSVYAIGQNLLL